LFSRIGKEASRVLVITEGLIIYLTPEEVGALARDLAAPASFQRWILELASPGLLLMLQKHLNPRLQEASAPLKFGPEEGPDFLVPYGWKPLSVRSLLKTAAKLKRAPWLLRLMAFLPESKSRQGSRPWSGVCLFEKRV